MAGLKSPLTPLHWCSAQPKRSPPAYIAWTQLTGQAEPAQRSYKSTVFDSSREARRLRQADLARLLGRGPATISKAERGERIRARVRQARLEAGLSPESLAYMDGVERSYFGRVERGRN